MDGCTMVERGESVPATASEKQETLETQVDPRQEAWER